MRKLFIIAIATISLLSCNKDTKSNPTIEGDWIHEKSGLVYYEDGEAGQETFTYLNNISSPYTFTSDNKIMTGSVQLGTYTSTTMTIQSVTYQITTINSDVLIGKENPNGKSDGYSNNIYLKK